MTTNTKNTTNDSLADALASAHRTGTTLAVAPWKDALSDAVQAYRVQDAVGRALGVFGTTPPQYWKSGGGSRDAVLTHAPLAPAGVRTGPARFDDMTFHTPGFEAEIALRLGRDVTPEDAAALDVEGAHALVDAMAVSIEIVDSRWALGDDAAGGAPALLKLADFQSHGALALGEWLPYARRDWSTQACEVRIGGRAPIVRTGSHPLGDPAWLLPTWLRHATRDGETIAAGTVVTTGSWVGLLPMAQGEAASVTFDGIGSLQVQL
jgi:2-keto-4-pentenoate hydratase